MYPSKVPLSHTHGRYADVQGKIEIKSRKQPLIMIDTLLESVYVSPEHMFGYNLSVGLCGIQPPCSPL